jgi:phage terminase large subunit-like protein
MARKTKPQPDAAWYETDPRLAKWRELRETEPGLMLTVGHKPEVQWAMDAKLLTEGYYFDFDAAQHFCDFAEGFIVLVEGECYGQPYKFQPHQLVEFRRLFGWKRADGTLRFGEVFKMIGRKNTKSTEAAIVGLYMTGFFGELGASVYACASNLEQLMTDGVMDQAIRMCELSDALAPLSDVVKSRANIMFAHAGNASFRALAGGRGRHGKNVFAVILDEVHEYRNRAMYEAMTTASGAKRQSLTYMITTAGDDTETLCYERYLYACKIRDGVLENPHFLPIIWELDKKDDWKDPENWKKANPMLGVSVKLEKMKDDFAKALASSAEEASFRRYRLNQWTNDAARWEHLREWLQCVGELAKPGEIPAELHGEDAYGGLDLSRKRDITSICVTFKRPMNPVYDTGQPIGIAQKDGYRCFWWNFIPEDIANEKQKRDGVPYLDWAKQGWLTLTPGNVIDYRVIREKLLELSKIVTFREVRFDPRFATELVQYCLDDGIPMVEQNQRMDQLSPPFTEVENCVIQGLLSHGNNPILNWMASNVALIQRQGMAIPAKDKSTGRIDGISALVFAVGGAMIGSNARSVYETRGIVGVGDGEDDGLAVLSGA